MSGQAAKFKLRNLKTFAEKQPHSLFRRVILNEEEDPSLEQLLAKIPVWEEILKSET